MFSLLFGKKKQFDEDLKDFRDKVDSLVTDIMSSAQDDLHINLMALQSPDKCNEYAIILADELGKKYQQIQLGQFADAMYITPINTHCTDTKCLSEKNIKNTYMLDNINDDYSFLDEEIDDVSESELEEFDK